MSENNQNNKNTTFKEKIKNAKANKAAVISTVLLVAAIAIIVGVTVATNRSRNNTLPKDTVQDSTQATDTQQTVVPEDTQPQTKPAETTPPSNASKPTSDELPTFILPVKGALLKDHDASVQVYSLTMNDYRVHLGIDVVTEENAPVYAAADGKIEKIWEDVKMGYCVAVKHGGDCTTIYKNLGETLPEGIAEGVSVRSGQLIATVGNSAMIEIAEEPHLHFEMTVNGLSVDPLEYYDEKSLEALGIDSSFEQ